MAYAQSVIGEYQGTAVGYALFFHNFSTFTGRPGIYLEDLYVQPHMRGQGFGKCLLAYLARLAVDKGCTRVEWSCWTGMNLQSSSTVLSEQRPWMSGQCSGSMAKHWRALPKSSELIASGQL